MKQDCRHFRREPFQIPAAYVSLICLVIFFHNSGKFTEIPLKKPALKNVKE